MVSVQHVAALHEKVVQQIARDALPRVQVKHTTGVRVAQRVTIQLVDDFDGTEADETVTFGLDGANYEIDLSKLNAKKLRHALADYVEVARRVGKTKPKARPGGSTKHIRDWARGQGMTVSNRGVVPAEIVAAYSAAH